jgi:diacylglycerol kinase (ATP)
MAPNRIKLILNPNADLGRAGQAAADLRPIVDEHGGVDWCGTSYPRHATELAFQAAQEGFDLVIAAGGDGTVHEVINGLMRIPEEQRPYLGVVPLGSGNDFSNAIGMDSLPANALRQILTGQPRRVDIGCLVDEHGRREYWDNTVGIGFDTVVTLRSRRFKLMRGFLIYLLAVIQTIVLDHDSPYLQVETENESWSQKTVMLVLCNGGREGGGFNVAPQAKLDDGIINYVGIEQVSRPMMFRLLPEVMNGTHARFRQVRTGECKKLSLRSDRPLFTHIDGEIYSGLGTDLRQLSVEILPGAIQVMVKAT